MRRTGIAHLPEPAGRKHCRVWLAPLFIKGCSDSAEPMGAFSPTCTALHGPSISGNPRCRASRADQVLLRITPSFSARGAAVLGCRVARAEMHSALAACNVRHPHLVRCLFGKTRSRHPCAPMRGCDAACPQASASAAAVWAGRPLTRRLRIRRNRRTRARSPTNEVAPPDERRTIFPVPCRHS